MSTICVRVFFFMKRKQKYTIVVVFHICFCLPALVCFWGFMRDLLARLWANVGYCYDSRSLSRAPPSP